MIMLVHIFSLIEVCHEAPSAAGNAMAVVGGNVIVGKIMHASDISIAAPSLERIEPPSWRSMQLTDASRAAAYLSALHAICMAGLR